MWDFMGISPSTLLGFYAIELDLHPRFITNQNGDIMGM
jgi:hypothetical protein